MNLIISLLTLVMVVDCLVLILLILIQLPKKEAGAGLAFGGAASDALFGAGSGTVLSKFTKYATGLFLALALLLAILQNHRARTAGFGLMRELEKRSAAGVASPAPPLSPTTRTQSLPVLQAGSATGAVTALRLPTTNVVTLGTNALAPATNAPVNPGPPGR